MSSVRVIAAYRFVDIDDGPSLRDRLQRAAQAGVPHVLQLDGGILRYLEDVPGTPHWQGRCFVFDERQALDTALAGVAA